MVVRVTQRFTHEWIGVGNSSGVGIEYQDAVFCRLNETALASLCDVQRNFGLLAFGDIPNNASNENSLMVGNSTEADFYGKVSSVFPEAQ